MKGIIEKVNIMGAEFNQFYLTEAHEPAFKYSSIFPNSFHEYVFNVESNSIIVRMRSKEEVTITLKDGFSPELKNELEKSRKLILKDLVNYGKRIESELEKVMAFDLNDEKIPFMFFTQTYIDNGQYSPKYRNAILYYINEMRKTLNKAIISNYEELLTTLGTSLKANIDKFEKKEEGRDIYYEIDFSYLASL